MEKSVVVPSADTSRSIPTSRTDKNPQTEGLLLPERDKQHSRKPGTAVQESAATDSHTWWERTGLTHSCIAQQQPKSSKPETVKSIISLQEESFQYVDAKNIPVVSWHIKQDNNHFKLMKTLREDPSWPMIHLWCFQDCKTATVQCVHCKN